MQQSEPRRTTYKSSENNTNQKISTTYINTPPRKSKNVDDGRESVRQCPYHFGQYSHICLTCRRSICLRCAITYCQQHTIHPIDEILPLLWVDLEKLTIEPRMDDIDLKLKQSRQRQEFVIGKIENILQQIEDHFEQLKVVIENKKEQILNYFKNELQDKVINDYRKYDEMLFDKLKWLREISNLEKDKEIKYGSIEELDQLSDLIKKEVPTGLAPSKIELKMNKWSFGKDKVKVHNIWSEERLEQVLFEIENISYKMKDQGLNCSFGSSHKKKRVTTEASDTNKNDKPDKAIQFNSSMKNPFAGVIIKSFSNSKFPTGRKIN